jgi:hypothetical protein
MTLDSAKPGEMFRMGVHWSPALTFFCMLSVYVTTMYPGGDNTHPTIYFLPHSASLVID